MQILSQVKKFATAPRAHGEGTLEGGPGGGGGENRRKNTSKKTRKND